MLQLLKYSKATPSIDNLCSPPHFWNWIWRDVESLYFLSCFIILMYPCDCSDLVYSFLVDTHYFFTRIWTWAQWNIFYIFQEFNIMCKMYVFFSSNMIWALWYVFKFLKYDCIALSFIFTIFFRYCRISNISAINQSTIPIWDILRGWLISLQYIDFAEWLSL